MKLALEYKILRATLKDKELFFRYLKKYYYPEEPMNSSINYTPESADELLVLNCLSQGLSFKAVDKSAVGGKNDHLRLIQKTKLNIFFFFFFIIHVL